MPDDTTSGEPLPAPAPTDDSASSGEPVAPDEKQAGEAPKANAPVEQKSPAALPAGKAQQAGGDKPKNPPPPPRPQSFWPRLFGSDDRNFGKPANQYLIALKASYLALLSKREGASEQQIWDELARIFAKYPDGVDIANDEAAWNDAYRCERLLVNIYDPLRLDVELDRRILEAQNSNLDFASFYVGRQQKPDADGTFTDQKQAANRSLLARLIEDQQWHDTRLYLKRGYAHTAQVRVSWAFFFALLIFGATMLMVFNTRTYVVSTVVAPQAEDAKDEAQPGAEKPADE